MVKTDRVNEVVAMLTSAGWTPDGETRSETVRIPTVRAPVLNHGKSGGELRTFGGRIRLVKGDRRVTVGPRTTCFYRVDSTKATGFNTTDFNNVPTKDTARIQELIQ